MTAAIQMLPETFRPMTMASGIRCAMHRSPNKVALICAERSLTYTRLVDRIDRVCALAAGLGLAAGDRAAIVAGNCLEYIEIVDGLAEAGVAVATVNPKQTPAEIGFILDDCGARVAFVTLETEPLVRAAACAAIERIIVIGEPYEALLADAHPGAPPAIAEWQAFAIPYTSGTTGKPRGVVLPHRSRALVRLLHGLRVRLLWAGRPYYLAVTPMFHGAGYSASPMPRYSSAAPAKSSPPSNRSRPCVGCSEERRRRHLPGADDLQCDSSGWSGRSSIGWRSFRLKRADVQCRTARRRRHQGDHRRLFRRWHPARDVRLDRRRYRLQPSPAATSFANSNASAAPFMMNHVKLLDDEGNPTKPGVRWASFSARRPASSSATGTTRTRRAAAMRDGWFSAGDLAWKDERRLLLHRRPQEGHVHLRRRERVPAGESRNCCSACQACGNRL